tara:strand:- start:2490 stop:2735 length:246 start_codon:yes stop_codon:yes gene_type:complete
MVLKDEFISEYECNYGEETIFTISKRRNKAVGSSADELIAGTFCNAGLVEHYNWEYDKSFTLDENLNDFIDYINESEMNLI